MRVYIGKHITFKAIKDSFKKKIYISIEIFNSLIFPLHWLDMFNETTYCDLFFFKLFVAPQFVAVLLFFFSWILI